MTPNFKVLANTNDITGLIKDRLLSLRVTDEAGFKSDAVEIRLDNRDDKIALPNKGAELEIWLGFKETGLSRMGLYTVDEAGSEWPVRTIVIPAKAANMKKSLKAQKTRSWDNVTYQTLFETIAAEHQLSPKVSASLASKTFVHLDQTNESDLHFLTRLAKVHDATAKPVMGNLVLLPRGEGKTVSGKNLPTIDLNPDDIASATHHSADRGKYNAVRAFWHNKATAQKVEERVGEGEPVYTIRTPFLNAEEAQAAALAKYNALQRGLGTVSLNMNIGQPLVRAEGKIRISGIGAEMNGIWSVTRGVHDYGSSAFTTKIEAETPKK